MMLDEAIFGALGLILFTTMIVYTVEILRNIWKNEELALTKLFIKPNAIKSFRLLAISALVFSTGMILAAASDMLQIPQLNTLSKISSIILFSGYVYFLHNIAHITEKSKQRP